MIKRTVCILLTILLTLTVLPCAMAETETDKPLNGQVVILYTNDIHGRAVNNRESLGYSTFAKMKQTLSDMGAFVLLVDGGDAMQGMPIVNSEYGKNAVTFMNAAGYDYAVPGNHEFDWGVDNLFLQLENADTEYLCANILDSVSKGLKFKENAICSTPDGRKIGFFGLDTPELMTKVNPDFVKGLKVLEENELYECAQKQVDYLKEQGCELIVCIGHLGEDDESKPNRSVDVIENVKGIDLFLDAHSHRKIEKAVEQGDTLRISTGCYADAVAYLVYAPAEQEDGSNRLTMQDNGLISCSDRIKCEIAAGSGFLMDDYVDSIVMDADDKVKAELSTVFGKTDVDLNGERAPGNRTEETNMGDLVTDALLWYAKNYINPDTSAAVINGGSIRAGMKKGDISMMELNMVFPFDNTVTTVLLSGSEILEAMEASVAALPDAMGAFPQVAGIVMDIDMGIPFENDGLYPESTYYKPKNPGSRVTIESIGGEPFDPGKLYRIAASNFISAGGDSYYAFRYAYKTSGIDSAKNVADAIADYIKIGIGGKVGEEYAEPQGRISIK